MKKCPYCSKELLDNAEFCLYCMRPLSLKNAKEHKIEKFSLKSALMIFVPLLAVIIAVAAIIIFKPKSGGDIFTAGKLTNSKYESINKAENQGRNLSSGNSSRETSHSDSQTSKNSQEQNFDYSEKGDLPVSGSRSSGSKSSSSASSKSSTAQTPSNNTSTSSESSASQDSQGETESQTFSFKAISGGIEITGIAKENASGEYSIPETLNGKPVISIGEKAFYYKKIKSISLPETLKTINNQAFAGCSYLSSVKIPKSVVKIGSNAFLPCNNLSSVYIASSDISVAAYAFSDSYNRNVELTIYAPSSSGLKDKAKLYWSAKYVEWNG